MKEGDAVMKMRLLILSASVSCVVAFNAAAQDYDDIYYDSSNDDVATVKEEKAHEAQVVDVSDNDLVANYFTADQTAGWKGNVVDERDVDEYNRQGDYYAAQSEMADTVAADTVDISSNGDTFQYTERIRRFHDPDVIAESDDEELVDLYVYTRPDVNIIVGTPTTTYVSPWGATVSFGSSVWYSTWVDPWYYDTWYYDPWYYRPYWYYSYRPWYWSWGWGVPYYAYHHHHYHDWWRPAPSHHRPYRTYSGGGRRLYANNGHSGYVSGTRGYNSRPTTAVGGRTSGRRGVSSFTTNGNSTRRQTTNVTGGRRNVASTGSASALNRYKTRINKTVVSSSNLSGRRQTSAISGGNRVANTNLTGRGTTTNRINLVTTGTSVRRGTSTVNRGAATTAVRQQRTNQLNRHSTFGGRSAYSSQQRSSGYRSTSRGTSYYRSARSGASSYNRGTTNYNRSSQPAYRQSRSTSSYSRGSSSYRSSTRSSGVSRSSGGVSRGGGRGRR